MRDINELGDNSAVLDERDERRPAPCGRSLSASPGDDRKPDRRDARVYLRLWAMAPGFIGDDVEALRKGVDRLTTWEALDAWLKRALDIGIDPL